MARDDAAETKSSETSGKLWKLVELVGEHLPIVITILGVTAYGALRLSFAAFYRHFGVDPEDVGLDYVTVLTVALPGVATLLLVSVIVAWLVYQLLALLPSLSKQANRERARGIAVLLFAAVALIVTIVAVAKSVNDASNAKEGENVEPTRVLEVTLLPWRVERAAIQPLSKDARQVLPGLVSTCLMYLGEGDGILVFYDVKDRHAVRIPVSSIALKTGEFASGCRVPD